MTDVFGFLSFLGLGVQAPLASWGSLASDGVQNLAIGRGYREVRLFRFFPGERDPVLAGFPWSKAQIVGTVYGEIDAEKLRSLRAELIVSRSWSSNSCPSSSTTNSGIQ